jgi:hypothetical protein
MQLYISRLAEGWVIHDSDSQYLGYDGQITGTFKRAYTSPLLTKTLEMYGKCSHPGWSLEPGNYQKVEVPQFNDPNLPDSEMWKYNTVVNMIGDVIYAVNAYNGVLLSKQEVVDQINLIAGNPQEDIIATVKFNLDNMTMMKRCIQYLVSQVEGDPVPDMLMEDTQREAVANTVPRIFQLDSLIRESVNLLPDAVNVIFSEVMSPICGNRQAAGWDDVLLGIKSAITYVAKFY